MARKPSAKPGEVRTTPFSRRAGWASPAGFRGARIVVAKLARLAQDRLDQIGGGFGETLGGRDLGKADDPVQDEAMFPGGCAKRHIHPFPLVGPARIRSIGRVAYRLCPTLASGRPCRNRNAASREAMAETTERLNATKAGIARAASLLGEGRLVAFPTETVYGLGGDARNGRAVAAIYEAKGRPSFNPLIVHVSSLGEARKIGDIPAEAAPFLDGGWPEGLTLVVPLRAGAGLSELVTAGLPTVALRVPASVVARDVLQAFGGPVAAPSANPSGRISPTTADHVLAGLAGRIAAVLDGGATEAGVESTIVGFEDGKPVVLREGAFVVPEGMARIAGGKGVTAPGQLASHYAPVGAVRLEAREALPGEWHIGLGEIPGDVSLSPSGDLREAAARLFALLHEADARGVSQIAVAPVPDEGLGRAINDRLRRAAAPRG